MTDYQKYINALRKCAKEHENDRTSTGHIIVSDLCRDTANLLEALEQEPCEDCISRQAVLEKAINVPIAKVVTEDKVICRKIVFVEDIQNLPSVTPQPYKESEDKACKCCYYNDGEVHAECVICDMAESEE